MLVVRIELWPHGDLTRCRTIATGRIINTGTGTPARGNYRIELRDALGRLWKSGVVDNFPRKRLLAWDLLTCALYSVLGSRNSLKSQRKQGDISPSSVSSMGETK